MKRLLDIIISTFGLIIVSPLFIPLVIILRLTGEGKIFYIQQRIGLKGEKFGLLKFATMLENSPNLSGGDITTKNDPRVLPVGRFLRKSKLNELPQILNILKGDMSLVGPRPLTPRNFDYYSPEVQKIIGELRPGLTGIGSIVFRDEERYLHNTEMSPQEYYKANLSPFKGQLEVWYHSHQNFFLDIQLIFITAYVIIFPTTKILRKIYKDLPVHEIYLP